MSASARPSLKGRIGRDSFFQLSADLPRLLELDIAAVAPNPEQPRQTLDPDAQAELAASIDRHGLLQPILVRRAESDRAESGAPWVLVAGQRRLAAMRALGRSTVPAIVTSGDPGEVALVENLQRQELDPFETAAAVRRLMQRHGYSQTAMGEMLGLRQNTVSALLALNDLPARIRAEYPTSDKVSKSLLIELAAVDDPDEQLRLWDAVKAGRMTVRAVRAARGGNTDGRAASHRKPNHAQAVLAEARRLLDRLQHTTVTEALRTDKAALAQLQTLHVAMGERLATLIG